MTTAKDPDMEGRRDPGKLTTSIIYSGKRGAEAGCHLYAVIALLNDGHWQRMLNFLRDQEEHVSDRQPKAIELDPHASSTIL